jgi:hypothetical protein
MKPNPIDPTYLSDCHNAPVYATGGAGDFKDSDRGITMHYECTECKQACNFHAKDTDTELDGILDAHAEYYIRHTMKFFQENGESPALSKNNKGDLQAKASISKWHRREMLKFINEHVSRETGEAGELHLSRTQVDTIKDNIGVKETKADE